MLIEGMTFLNQGGRGFGGPFLTTFISFWPFFSLRVGVGEREREPENIALSLASCLFCFYLFFICDVSLPPPKKKGKKREKNGINSKFAQDYRQ